MWLLYALLGVLIIFFPMLTKPRKETMKKMWVGYILLGIILGFMHVNRNKDDDSIDGFGCPSCSK
jgi:drug/metabolite transporter (DMT)-like permease